MQGRFPYPCTMTTPACVVLALFMACHGFGQASSSTDTLESHLGKGYEALKQERYDAAAEEFRAALALDPSLTERARFPLAIALFEAHQPEAARREFEQVRRETGDHPNVLYYLGRLDLDERNFPAAIRNLTQAAAKPPFPDTPYYLGFAYFKQGNLVTAERWLKQAARANAGDSRIPYRLALLYRKQGRTAEAEKARALSARLRQQDSRQSQLRMECRQKLDQGQREEARNLCRQLYDPEDADALTELGTIYAQHGDLEDALEPLRRAAEVAPKSPQVQYNLALAYYQLNRFAEARIPLAGAVQRWPDLFQLNALYGAVLYKLGDYSLAYQALGRAHKLNSQDVPTEDLLYLTIFELGRSRQQAREYSESIRFFEEAARLRPQEPAPHRHLAEIYTAAGRALEAVAEQQEADRLTANLTGSPR